MLIDTALFTELVNFDATYLGKTRGMASFELSWDTVAEESLVGFVLKRGEVRPFLLRPGLGRGPDEAHECDERRTNRLHDSSW